jgi:hypothetical protein
MKPIALTMTVTVAAVLASMPSMARVHDRTASASAPAPASSRAKAVTVPAAPPPAPHEATPEAPDPSYVLVPGHWSWTDGAYVWVPPLWVVPPSTHATWSSPRWLRRGHTWLYVRGHWSSNAPLPTRALVAGDMPSYSHASTQP